MTLAISILGTGTIGSEIAAAIADGRLSDVRIDAVYDIDPARVEAFVAETELDSVSRVDDVDELPRNVDLVIEAAAQPAVVDHAAAVLSTGTDMLIMSVGAFADTALLDSVRDAAETSGARVYLPSGAIAGLDAIKAAAGGGGLSTVSLTTTKPPAGLAGAPYVVENGIDLDSFTEETVVFEGPAREAAAAFPSNVNVAVSLSLAGVGVEETTVQIVADPDASNNQHAIRASGDAGEIETRVTNVPSPSNPKTSYLAPLSAIETLRGLTAPINVGT